MSFHLDLADGDRLEVAGDRLTVGRGTDRGLRLPEDRTVDLEHCQLTVAGGICELTDLGSLTHTYLNGEAVERARVMVGDRVGVGGTEITLTKLEGDHAEIAVRQLGGDVAGAGHTTGRPPVDYAAAYALSRPGLLSKTTVSLAAMVVALLGTLTVAALVAGGKTTIPRPGAVSAAHAKVDLGARCADCHAPFAGADDQRCEACHQGPEHQARQTSNPPCGSCHSEHRALRLVDTATDGRCLECHLSLEIAGGGEPKVARRVTSFDDHPELEPITDNTPLAFNHALHLKPGLPVAGGRTTLDCADCHVFEAASSEILAVTFEQHCQRCHDLVFDPLLEPAPHGDPETVAKAIVGAYLRDPNAARSLSGDGLRSLIFGGRRGALSFDESTRRRALNATDQVLRNQCTKCHRVEIQSALKASVEAVVLPARWLEGARFGHGPHRGVACIECHGEAATSRTTPDVLIPAKAACLPCHGEGKETPTTCVTCHHYHEKSATGWEATRIGAAPATVP